VEGDDLFEDYARGGENCRANVHHFDFGATRRIVRVAFWAFFTRAA
jgi:hypothetical protein